MNQNKFKAKKEEIKDAGIKSFSAYGYYKTTMEDIAGMLGMKKNSLYYYFANKEALFHEIIEEEIKAHMSFLKNTISQNMTADKKLLTLIDGLIEFIRQRTLKYTVRVKAYLEISKVIKNEFKEFQEKECLHIEYILNEGIKSGLFKKHNTKILAQDIEYLVPAIFRSFYSDSNQEFVNDIDFGEISAIINRLLSYIIDGIKVRK